MADETTHSITPRPEREQYLIGSVPAASLAAVADVLRADPDVEVVKLQGSAERPEMIVARMSPQRAERLKQEFGGGLTVEPDAPLMPF
jgi:hypothetical protein